MFGRRYGFEQVLAGEQSGVDVMADGVNMWGLEARFGYKIVQEITKAWNVFFHSVKREIC